MATVPGDPMLPTSIPRSWRTPVARMPRWLLDHDRVEDAYKSFKAVRAETTDSITKR